MREIKFRGKAKDNGEWVYGYYWKQGDNKYWIRPLEAIGSFSIQVIPETIGQYIGLKDKNNEEIYKGDIIKLKFYLDQKAVEYEVMVIRNFIEDTYWLKTMKEQTKYIKTIGNIYENPELLKGEE